MSLHFGFLLHVNIHNIWSVVQMTIPVNGDIGEEIHTVGIFKTSQSWYESVANTVSPCDF